MSGITLHGFGPSVYTRVVKIVLAEKSIDFRFEEINPFAETSAGDLRALHPFGQVPILDDAGFRVYETAAITCYIDARFPAPCLVPTGAEPLARMAQVITIVDAHGYWPMVRQVFAHRVFRPKEGLDADENVIAEGIHGATPVLEALDRIANEGLVLDGETATLADCHLAPMVAAFAAAPEGGAALNAHDALATWWRFWSRRQSMQVTDAGFDHLVASGA